jgi:hypothetical protein
MSYGQPQEQQPSSVYTVQVAYTPTTVNVPMTIELDLAAVGDQGVTIADADQAFQAAIDLLTESGDFTVLQAGEKRYHVIVPVTASA